MHLYISMDLLDQYGPPCLSYLISFYPCTPGWSNGMLLKMNFWCQEADFQRRCVKTCICLQSFARQTRISGKFWLIYLLIYLKLKRHLDMFAKMASYRYWRSHMAFKYNSPTAFTYLFPLAMKLVYMWLNIQVSLSVTLQ